MTPPLLRAAILTLVAALILSAQEIHREGPRFIVSGWTLPPQPQDGWKSIFRIYAGSEDLPPVLGAYSEQDAQLVFTPRFPLTPGLAVRAVLHVGNGRVIERSFQIVDSAKREQPEVLQIYPSTHEIPENQLKLYIRFSAPMQRGEAWDRLRLLMADGTQVELPFLEIDQELWDPNGKRLTVLFDPGRIKRGVLPLEEIGPALEAGKRYTVVVDATWRDANGTPLVKEYRREFHVVPADREPPDPRSWNIRVPKAGTTEPLVVRFPEPMDHALLLRMLEVKHGDAALNGTMHIGKFEKEWSFVPAQPWQAAEYRIVVDRSLEDLAGNRIGRPFDVDTVDAVTKQVSSGTVSLPFRIRTEQR